MGIYIGSGLAFILGGVVISATSSRAGFVLPVVGVVRPWQIVFLLVGLPGLLVALLMLTIREPARKGVLAKRLGGTAADAASVGAVLAYVRDNRATFLYLNLGIALVALYGYGATSWVPTFFIRRYAWSPGQTGLVFGIIVAIGGTLGIVTGGRLADWLRQRGHADANLRVALLGAALGLPFTAIFPLAPTAVSAAVLLAPVLFFMSMPFGVAPAAIQQMMPNTMRAQASACYLFVINVIGLGLGPCLVAVLTEKVYRQQSAIHHSLLVVGAVSFAFAAILLWRGLKPYRLSLAYLKEWSDSQA
jgi:MFS family permease